MNWFFTFERIILQIWFRFDLGDIECPRRLSSRLIFSVKTFYFKSFSLVALRWAIASFSVRSCLLVWIKLLYLEFRFSSLSYSSGAVGLLSSSSSIFVLGKKVVTFPSLCSMTLRTFSCEGSIERLAILKCFFNGLNTCSFCCSFSCFFRYSSSSFDFYFFSRLKSISVLVFFLAMFSNKLSLMTLWQLSVSLSALFNPGWFW